MDSSKKDPPKPSTATEPFFWPTGQNPGMCLSKYINAQVIDAKFSKALASLTSFFASGLACFRLLATERRYERDKKIVVVTPPEVIADKACEVNTTASYTCVGPSLSRVSRL